MVKIKHEMLKTAIKKTKIRIKHMEKHGIGTAAIKEKQILQKQERKLQLLKDAGYKL